MASPTTTTRRSKRKQSLHYNHQPSSLQLQLETAIESPGGITKILSILQSASNNDIDILNTNQYGHH